MGYVGNTVSIFGRYAVLVDYGWFGGWCLVCCGRCVSRRSCGLVGFGVCVRMDWLFWCFGLWVVGFVGMRDYVAMLRVCWFVLVAWRLALCLDGLYVCCLYGIALPIDGR